jgi:hypothetical protein
MKPIQYLSPSSFMEYNTCSWKFINKRLMGRPKALDTQGIPAAMGCAFDVYMKRYLARQLKIDNRPDLEINTLLSSVSIPDTSLREEILEQGKSLAMKYIDLGFTKRLLSEGLSDVEVDKFLTMPLHPDFSHMVDRDGHLIPDLRLFGKLDCVITQENLLIPHDFKIRGYKSKSGYSPTPGYKMYITSDGKTKEYHTKHECPIDELNERWAIQLTIYAWMLNHVQRPGENLPLAIDEITFGRNNIVFSQIRSFTSVEYQKALWRDLSECWVTCHQVTEEEMPIAMPTNYKCNMFNIPCELQAICEEYQFMLNADQSVIGRMGK